MTDRRLTLLELLREVRLTQVVLCVFLQFYRVNQLVLGALESGRPDEHVCNFKSDVRVLFVH